MIVNFEAPKRSIDIAYSGFLSFVFGVKAGLWMDVGPLLSLHPPCSMPNLGHGVLSALYCPKDGEIFINNYQDIFRHEI